MSFLYLVKDLNNVRLNSVSGSLVIKINNKQE